MIFWIWVGKELAAGALSYVGGKAMGSIFDGKDAGPTNTDIINAIKESVGELKHYFSEDIRKALTEDALKTFRGDCEGIDRNLMTYSTILSPDQAKYDYLIINSDTETSKVIGRCHQYGPIALPIMANFISLRTVAKKAIFELKGSNTAYLQYATELRGYVASVMDEADRYIASLDPALRVGKLECEEKIEGSGGGFKTRTYFCKYTLDGVYTAPSGGLSGDGSLDGFYHDRAERERSAKIGEVSTFRDECIKNFHAPLKEITQTWLVTVDKIEKQAGGNP